MGDFPSVEILLVSYKRPSITFILLVCWVTIEEFKITELIATLQFLCQGRVAY